MTTSYSYEGLDPKYRQIAAAELKESPELVQAHITSLRRWLKQCPHISGCPDDDSFLLQHLRAGKFNQEKAQSRLENFCTVRASVKHGVPSAFNYPPVDHESVKKTFGLGVQIPLGYNEKGEFIVLVRMGAWDPDVLDFYSMRPVNHMGADAMMADERMQIAGCHLIFDMGGMSKKDLELIFDRKLAKENAMAWQDGYAMRQKGFYYYREPLIFDIIFKMLKFWMSPKLTRRVHRVGNDLSKLHEKCPGSKKLLPTEYGGEAGSLQECIDRWYKEFCQFWANGPDYSQLKIDDSKRPAESKKYLRQYDDYADEIFGTQGTYTKIDAM